MIFNIVNDKLMNDLLSSKKHWFLDGGFSNQIEAQGVDLHPTLWTATCSIYNYTNVLNVHKIYAAHGAEILLTSTYQMSEKGFSDGLGLKNETKKIMQLAIKAACEVKNKTNSVMQLPKVGISVGPYGACLADGSEYNGNYGLESNALNNLTKFHQSRLSDLLQANIDYINESKDNNGADLFAFETIPCITEIKAIALAIKALEIDRKYPFYISFSLKDARTLNSNESIQEAVKILEELLIGIDFGIGVNCCNPNIVKEALINIEAACTIKGRVLICYPNLGELWNAESRCWEIHSATSLHDFSKYAVEWANIGGARVIGGCCRTTPAHIRDLKYNVLKDSVK